MTTSTPVADATLLALRVRVPRNVVHKVFPAETVVLNLDTGLYHGLNTIAGQMLLALERTATVADAATAISRDFPQIDPVRIRQDICTLCRELTARGLIELTTPA